MGLHSNSQHNYKVQAGLLKFNVAFRSVSVRDCSIHDFLLRKFFCVQDFQSPSFGPHLED